MADKTRGQGQNGSVGGTARARAEQRRVMFPMDGCSLWEEMGWVCTLKSPPLAYPIV
jgi:hypothetical protein